MKKQLFIHIGFGKTGTTSVQDTFHASRDLLKQNGVLYPVSGLSGTGHHALAPLNETVIQGRAEDEYEKLLDEIAADESGKVLISSENFSFIREEYVAATKALFAEFDTKIIFYVRPQVELIESTYLEWIKVGRKCPDNLAAFFRQNANGFNFISRLASWRKVYGSKNIVVCRYGGDTRIEILRTIGVPVEMFQAVFKRSDKRSNPSLSPEFVKLATLINRLQLEPEKRLEMMQELLRLTKLLDAKRVTKLMKPALKAVVEEHYAPSNEKILELFGVDVLGKE